ncbi:hypothetical protein Prum_021440 [Phytohabitans rumicis]|uniref:Uncharacterized protein n=2 Tax=Phytohabitans rumicis TaxID=1076125 RepID=A0A6V8KTS0_9ACTN|nr:hypothetical protein Prum_021440 [Phytohabitans rumicis]
MGPALAAASVIAVVAGGNSAVVASPRGAGIERVSVSTGGGQADGDSAFQAISANGRFVAFDSFGSNLVPQDTNGALDVFVRDRRAGTTERVSVSGTGQQGGGDSYGPAISADGRYVAFGSFADLVPGDINGIPDIFVRDRLAGTTTQVSVSSSEVPADYESRFPAISADGRYITFSSSAGNLVRGDTNEAMDVFVRDRLAGTTTRVSVSSTGGQADGISDDAAISANGRFVTFATDAANLVRGDTNDNTDVLVRDRLAGTTTRVSVSSSGGQANAYNVDPVISADGRYIAFESYAANLAGGDTNDTPDIYVHDRWARSTTRVSVSSTGEQPDRFAGGASISANGRWVLFYSDASNLTPAGGDGLAGAFVRDRLAGTTTRVTPLNPGWESETESIYLAKISADGRSIVFTTAAANLVPDDTNDRYDVFARDIG